jgi:hypothetical protein
MKPLLICMLSALLTGTLAFSQTDTTEKEKSSGIFIHKHFNNPLHNFLVTEPPSLSQFSILHISERKISSFYNSKYSYTPYSSYQQHNPLWKDIMTVAAQAALSGYASSRNYMYIPPMQ